MYMSVYSSFWPNLFFKKDVPYPFPLVSPNHLLFRYGSDAIWNALRILDLSQGDRVLVPAYLCTAAVKPLKDYGVKVDYFHLAENLEPDKRDIESKITAKTRAIFIVHYFGFPQDLNYFGDLGRRHGLYLIEDCAQAFLSKDRNRPLGSIGDVAIFSLRKTIPVPDGAVLVTNHSPMTYKEPVTKTGTKMAVKGILNQLVINLEFRMGYQLEGARKFFEKRKYFFNSFESNNQQTKSNYEIAISGISRWLIYNQFNYEEIYSKRRRNFGIILEGVQKIKGVKALFKNLAKGICPTFFPIIIERRDAIHEFLLKNGLVTQPWPYLPEEIKKGDFPVANYLAQNILLLPVHQDLNLKHINNIINYLQISTEKLL